MRELTETQVDGPRSSLTLRGQIDGDVAALFIEQLAQLSSADAPLTIELAQAQLDDAALAPVLADHLAQTAERIGAIHLIGTPSALADEIRRLGSGARGVHLA
ncbi:MAG: hypothetical protein IT384_24515 [Deltaproteobacteria bacterium]|nr:hypothetical protein [Deltaproteobacteria bacterium]